MNTFHYYPHSEFQRVTRAVASDRERLPLIAAMVRLNTLVAIKKAGSGHLGSSLSAVDMMVWLYHKVMNVARLGVEHPDRDIFFSSKGHDVPGQYSVMMSAGLLTESKLFQLRRLSGLDGHPDVRIPGCEANTGSLGMGISKGRGNAWAKRFLGRKGRVFVMTGDGELQEGQIWESVQTCVHHRVPLTVIVDHNKIQTDLPVEEIISLGDLAGKFRAFGCAVERCDGHDFTALNAAFARLEDEAAPCRILIADTIKGRGVSFMEQIATTATAAGKYLWHSGAPADEPFDQAFTELVGLVREKAAGCGVEEPRLQTLAFEMATPSGVSKEYVAAAYGEELCAVAEGAPHIVVLDGDLAADCKVRSFSERFPDRFIENGIAEQDMVSVAGGLARQGLLPVVNSFSSFLCARANEQIYNNACEQTRIVYAAHFSGMIPAGPGKSHQSIRDIALLSSIPNMVTVQPSGSAECRLITRWALCDANDSVCLRLNIGPSPRVIDLPTGYSIAEGRGFVIKPGVDIAILAYGPVMLNEALAAADIARRHSLNIKVINTPWLNRFDIGWYASVLDGVSRLFVIDDHLLAGGFGEKLCVALTDGGLLQKRRLRRLGLMELPACGTPLEVLRHHGLNGEAIAAIILDGQGIERKLPEGDLATAYNTLESAQ